MRDSPISLLLGRSHPPLSPAAPSHLLLLGWFLQVLTDVVANVADFDGDGIITNYEFYTALDPNQVPRPAPSSRVHADIPTLFSRLTATSLPPCSLCR